MRPGLAGAAYVPRKTSPPTADIATLVTGLPGSRTSAYTSDRPASSVTVAVTVTAPPAYDSVAGVACTPDTTGSGSKALCSTVPTNGFEVWPSRPWAKMSTWWVTVPASRFAGTATVPTQ